MMVNSKFMELKFPGAKIKKIKIEAHHLLATPNVLAQQTNLIPGQIKSSPPDGTTVLSLTPDIPADKLWQPTPRTTN